MKEDALTRVLRGLPLRSAPLSLQRRVMQQLERNDAAPWWKQGFMHWPAAMRVSFVAASLALIAVSILDARWSTLDDGVLHRLYAGALLWTNPAVWATHAAADIGIDIARFPASDWISLLMAIAALLYAFLAGLGVLAYRTLYLTPHPDR